MKNSEMKTSLGFLAVILLLFVIYQTMMLQSFYNDFKRDYIHTWSGVAGKLVEQNPENESEIMHILSGKTKDFNQYIASGKVILNQYGISEDVSLELFPYLNQHISFYNQFIFWGCILLCVTLLLVTFIQYKSFFGKIKQFIRAADKIVEGNYEVVINENREGDLARLAVSFQSMKEVIRKNMHDLLAEKTFLVQTLHDLSHQLKTPLSTLMVNNDILLNGKCSLEQCQMFTQRNQVQLSRMNDLIHNVLKVAKVDARAIAFDKERINLIETIYEAIDILQSKCREKNITIDLEAADEIVISHDRIWIQEALINILKNSIEHSHPDSQICVRVKDTPIHTEITIQDFGEGIEREDLPHIFDRFYKAKHSKKRDSIGIGLALSKSVIEAHDGFIRVESRRFEFTRFTITFLKY
ncbi:HAMP domain-containing sensor histidine kinase [Baia soyae]|uniref:histidine kinase n=1 Tax=Baia soyae TaxID=1544746 RepID=A0A4R2RZJ8_9BACL|nr:HAMP domain-containing sensor histidine kinase [Baia soyae]TCP68549.1 signal transduction histidine kinase [Baia soyae]